MTVVGITGHRELRHPVRVRRELDAVLADAERPLVGVTALAAGADQLFAAAVLEAGGALEVVVPGQGYVESLPADARSAFDHFVGAASLVTVLEFDEPGSDAYLAAGIAMLDRCDALIAVWDGESSRGTGGTADMVRRARERGIPVHVIAAERAPADG